MVMQREIDSSLQVSIAGPTQPPASPIASSWYEGVKDASSEASLWYYGVFDQPCFRRVGRI